MVGQSDAWLHRLMPSRTPGAGAAAGPGIAAAATVGAGVEVAPDARGAWLMGTSEGGRCAWLGTGRSSAQPGSGHRSRRPYHRRVSDRPTNRLARETSPYLLQHAHDPVDWFAWGDEAFERARLTDRPICLSIGYAACHWCHVMEHESFADERTAADLNAGFVAIKVDREERPDVDELYMGAVQAMTGQGGWPMSLFLTDRKSVV